MTSITLPDDTDRRLASRAAALATTPEALAVAALDQLARSTPATDTLPAADAVARLRDFDALIADFRARPPACPPGHAVDVSREAMSAGSGG